MKYRNVITLVVFGSNSIIVNARKFSRNDKINRKRIQYLVSRTNSTPHFYYTNKTVAIVFLFLFFFRGKNVWWADFFPCQDEKRHGERKMKMDDGERERRKGRQYRIKRGLRDMNNSGCVKMSQNRDSTRRGGAFSSLKSIKSSKLGRFAPNKGKYLSVID